VNRLAVIATESKPARLRHQGLRALLHWMNLLCEADQLVVVLWQRRTTVVTRAWHGDRWCWICLVSFRVIFACASCQLRELLGFVLGQQALSRHVARTRVAKISSEPTTNPAPHKGRFPASIDESHSKKKKKKEKRRHYFGCSRLSHVSSILVS
jgi:hypothetical protein